MSCLSGVVSADRMSRSTSGYPALSLVSPPTVHGQSSTAALDLSIFYPRRWHIAINRTKCEGTMAKSTQSSHIIICDVSAFRTLRCERRRYQSLGWTPLSSREIQLAVSRSSANVNCIDYELLEQLGIWSPGEKLHLLVGSSAKRRYTSPVYPHTITKPLPARSLYNIAPGIDILSPMMIATQYASHHSFGQTYAFFEELCSEITLAEPGYEEWLPGDTEKKRHSLKTTRQTKRYRSLKSAALKANRRSPPAN